MKTTLCLLSIALLGLLPAGAFAAPPQALLLTFGPGLSFDHSYSSRPHTSVQTIDGAKVVLQRERGTEYRIQPGQKTWTWFQIEQVPAQESYLAVTPRIQGDTVSLEVDYLDRQGSASTRFSSTLQGDIGSWILLIDESAAVEDGPVNTQRSYNSNPKRTHYSSAYADRLAVRVDRVK